MCSIYFAERNNTDEILHIISLLYQRRPNKLTFVEVIKTCKRRELHRLMVLLKLTFKIIYGHL